MNVMRGTTKEALVKALAGDYGRRHGAALVAIAAAVALVLGVSLAPRQALAQDSDESVAMYRLYNRWSGEHFYTSSESERDTCASVGWSYEGVGWWAPVSSSSPVYRLYNPYSGDHHYTMSASERDWLAGIGWRDEGIGWYSSDAKAVPLYRQFNPYETIGTHNYTKSKDENDHLASIGWRAEGIAWYGVRHWVDEQGHWEDVTEQVWVPNVVDVDDYEDRTIYGAQLYVVTEVDAEGNELTGVANGPIYWFYTDADEKAFRDLCFYHMKNDPQQKKVGDVTYWSYQNKEKTERVKVGSHQEDHGYYETKVTGKKWAVDTPAHWE